MFYNYLAEKKSRNKIYQGCDSSVEIAQNSHDVAVLLSIKQFFNAGYIKPKYDFFNLSKCLNSRSVNRYILRDTKIIIDFVDKYPMLTRKHLDYLDWKKIVFLKLNGAHKTEEGLVLMKKIISNMNSKRDSDQ
jgi:LAGLIDADG endonuclease